MKQKSGGRLSLVLEQVVFDELLKAEWELAGRGLGGMSLGGGSSTCESPEARGNEGTLQWSVVRK